MLKNYDGTNWTAGDAANLTGRRGLGGFGTQTAATVAKWSNILPPATQTKQKNMMVLWTSG